MNVRLSADSKKAPIPKRGSGPCLSSPRPKVCRIFSFSIRLILWYTGSIKLYMQARLSSQHVLGCHTPESNLIDLVAAPLPVV